MRSLHGLAPALAVLTFAAACATANGGGGGDDSGDDTVDIDADPGAPDAAPADAAPPIDAAPPDAAMPMAVTVSQNTNATQIVGGSVACAQNPTDYTTENSYYRVFNLPQMGVTGQLTAQRVHFGIESASHSSGSQTVQVRLHTLNGAFQLANLTQLHGQNVLVANTGTTPRVQEVILSSPVVVPAGSQLVAEVYVPDGTTTQTTFFIGSNNLGQSGPSYIRAPGCSVYQPATFASLNYPDVHIILTVSGTTP